MIAWSECNKTQGNKRRNFQAELICSASESTTSSGNTKQESVLMLPLDIPTPMISHPLLHTRAGSVFF
ncbi:hypothetical protein RB195_017530 [Necator americanus]|uniref:Uncharacterized protein n=1 Tax=Necator americanus TaxID=51031 RepID=A0ABR1C7S3_NECAM